MWSSCTPWIVWLVISTTCGASAPPDLTGRGVRVEFLKEQLTFTGEDNAMAQLLLSVMGAFAEFERSLIRERQREGVALAKARGAYRGRKRILSEDRIAELRQRAAAPGRRRPRWRGSSASAGRRCISTCGPGRVTPPADSGRGGVADAGGGVGDSELVGQHPFPAGGRAQAAPPYRKSTHSFGIEDDPRIRQRCPRKDGRSTRLSHPTRVVSAISGDSRGPCRDRPWHHGAVSRWPDVLTSRRYVDLLRVASAVCRGCS